MNTQLQIDFAKARADVGIERSAARADRVLPGWTDRAAEAVRESLGTGGMGWLLLCNEFTIEELRETIKHNSTPLDEPPDARAWGHVTRRAVKLGYIERVQGKFGVAASSNGAPKPLYRKGKAA